MEFRIADTFTDSLGRLTADEQKAVKTTAFDLQMNPAAPGLSFHKLDKARDKNFWSVRVSRDIRLIVHRTASSLLLCYVDHHDPAYDWAERRRLEVHPTTGAAQLVEVRHRIEEIVDRRYVEVPPETQPTTSEAPKPPLFAGLSDIELLGYGVPELWLPDVRAANEDTLLDLADHLPAEAAEALLELATGGTPKAAPIAAKGADPFAHPDAQRRFRVVSDIEELERALDFPWDKWTIFLHPAQRHWVERDYNGPSRVSGSAGTGKTIVALHRAVHLARSDQGARVLLSTFSDTLANALRMKLFRLVSNQPKLAERIDVHSMNAIGERLYEKQFGKPNFATRDEIASLLNEVAKGIADMKFSPGFLLSEWKEVVEPWQLDSWDAYRDVQRLGRKTRLPEAQRAQLWKVFDEVRARLQERGKITKSSMFTKLATSISERRNPLYDYAVVDEAQDISVPQLRFLAALGGQRSNALFFAGDLGQRIFQQPFSWKSLGVDIRGRSRTLHINYRTSHQIRSQADKLLGPEVSDIDGNIEERKGTVSVFNGPEPSLHIFATAGLESKAIGEWLRRRINEGISPNEVGVFVRSEHELPRALEALAVADIPFTVLNEEMTAVDGCVSVSTMHLAKGLEFKAVAVMACDDEIVPSQARIESVTDDADLAEIYNSERHLLYVACTRARDNLHVSAVTPGSEFLQDLTGT